MGKIKIQRGWWEADVSTYSFGRYFGQVPNLYADVPSELAGSPFFIYSNTPCVYLILKEAKVVYVGKTSTLGRRISDHTNTRSDAVSYIYYETESEVLCDMLETALIRLFNPIENTAKIGELTETDIAVLLSNGILNFNHQFKESVFQIFKKRASRIVSDEGQYGRKET